MIVADTNIVAYFLIDGDHTTRAEAVRARDGHWRVPPLFVHEWISVIAAHVRADLFDRDEAIRTYRRGLAIVRVEQAPVDVIRVLNPHVATGCSTYDCQFIELAERLCVPLVTLDGQVLAANTGVAVDLETFARGR